MPQDGGTEPRSPAFGDEDELHAVLAELVRPVLYAVLAGTLSIAVVSTLIGVPFAAVIAYANVVVHSLLLVALQRGHTKWVPISSAMALLATATVSMLHGSGLNDIATLLLPVTCLVASLGLSSPQLRITATATGGVAILTALLQVSGIAGTAPPSRDRVLDAMVMPIIVITVSLMTLLIGSSLVRRIVEAKASERRQRELFDAVIDPVLLCDARTGAVTDANDRAVQAFGYERRQLLGRGLNELLTLGGSTEQVDLLSQAGATEHGTGGRKRIWRAMRADKTSFRAEVTLRRSDSKRRPRLMVVVRDVEELKAVEDRVRLAEKMEALGQLAGGIAHDFNNQIAGIGVYAEAIRQRSNDPTAVVSFAEGIITATRRASDVVGRLLAFARRHQEMREPVELHGLVREVGELLSHSVPNGVSVKLELGARSPEVLGDASLLQSALLNLGLNARDAILAGTGRGTIVLRSRDVADTPRVEGQDGAVAVEVCDDGVGMSEDVLSRLFQPFFTTKSEGTGMGLAVSYGTVRAHGGVIEVESTQGKGSVLRVLLPRYGSREQTGRVRLDAASGSMKRIQARVLLVESEPTVADSARRLLSHLGCQVVHVMDGDAALQTHRRAAAAFDFVLLDTSTGRVEGTRLIEGLRGTSPGLPVAVSADPTELEVIRHLVAEHGALFVPRPYRLGELSRVLVDGLKLEGSLAPISSERGAS